LKVLADSAKTNVKVLIALQDIARGSQHYCSTGHSTSTHEGIKLDLQGGPKKPHTILLSISSLNI